MYLLVKLAVMVFGNGFKVTFMRRRGVKIGRAVNFLTHYMPSVEESKRLSIGDYTTVSGNVLFIFHDGAVGPLINRNPKFIDKSIHVFKRGTISIGKHVFIGASSILLPDINVGDFSVVAAGSVVSKNIPSGEIWGGVPARFIKKTEEYVYDVLDQNDLELDEKTKSQVFPLTR
jgi:acetyltransferase-like isoleucine patch superfamily enzyme